MSGASRLEVISRLPAGDAPHPVQLLFVHGAYTGAWCWDEHFLPWFAERGYAAHALSLSGHGESPGRAQLDGISIADYVSDVVEVVAQLQSPLVLIGHSMGGMVVQKYLEQAPASAAVLLCAVPPHGLAASAIGLMFDSPQLLSSLNNIINGAEPTAAILREALFHQPVAPEHLARYVRLCQPESHRALWDMTLFNLPRLQHMTDRPPILVLGAEHDRLIPPSQVHSTAKAYATEADILPDLGHAVMLESGWEAVARRIADWLASTLPRRTESP